MKQAWFGGLVVTAVALSLLAGAVQLQAARERRYPDPPITDDEVVVQSGPLMRTLAGAFAPIAADAYWVRAIQYYGGTKRRLAMTLPPPGAAAPPVQMPGKLHLRDALSL